MGELAEDRGIDDEFEKFFRTQYSPAVVTLMTSGFVQAEAEDAVHTAMVELYEHWSSIDHPKAWVRKVAFREAAARRRRHLDGLRRAAIATPDEIGDDCEQIDARQRIVRWLRLLNERQRKVVALRLDGFADGEIATMLEIERSTVRSTHRNAMAALREIIERERRAESETEGGR